MTEFVGISKALFNDVCFGKKRIADAISFYKTAYLLHWNIVESTEDDLPIRKPMGDITNTLESRIPHVAYMILPPGQFYRGRIPRV